MLKNETIRLERDNTEDYFLMKMSNAFSIVSFHMVLFIVCFLMFGILKGMLLHYVGSFIMTINLFFEICIKETEFSKQYLKICSILGWMTSVTISIALYASMFFYFM